MARKDFYERHHSFLAEKQALFSTLQSLAGNPKEMLSRFLTLVVVNHREDASLPKQDNRETSGGSRLAGLISQLSRLLGCGLQAWSSQAVEWEWLKIGSI
jgi:hypothetical protein